MKALALALGLLLPFLAENAEPRPDKLPASHGKYADTDLSDQSRQSGHDAGQQSGQGRRRNGLYRNGDMEQNHTQIQVSSTAADTGLLESASPSVPSPYDVCPLDCRCVDHLYNCSYGDREDIPDFTVPESVQSLNLSRNHIKELGARKFAKYTQLLVLDLSRNQISKLQDYAFDGARRLKTLILDSNKIKTVDGKAFKGLTQLNSLNLHDNPVTHYSLNMLKGLKKLSTLRSDSSMLCCLADHKLKQCLSDTESASSCSALLKYDILRIVLWIVAVCSSIGNFLVMLIRIRRRELGKASAFLVFNLAMADWLMCCYLVSIGTADLLFKNSYMEEDTWWRKSIPCNIAGVTFTISSEVSVVTLSLITLERLSVVLNPGRIRSTANPRVAYVACACVWFVAIVIAVVPLIPMGYFEQSFYSRSALCLPLHITKNRFPGWEFSVLIFMGVNLVSLAVVTGGYGAIYVMLRQMVPGTWQLQVNKMTYEQEVTLTRRLAWIVLSDVCCWLPIIVLNVMALTEMDIPEGVYSWVAVLILPLNSALNPVLFTFMSYRSVLDDMMYTRSSSTFHGRRCRSLPDINMTSIPETSDGLEVDTPDGATPGPQRTLGHELERGLDLTLDDLHKLLTEVTRCIDELNTDTSQSEKSFVTVNENTVVILRGSKEDASLHFKLKAGKTMLQAVDETDQDSLAQLTQLVRRLEDRFGLEHTAQI